MLPQQNRLTKKEDFKEVKEKGRKVQSDSFAFAYLSRPEEKPSRFGFVVSTKISKKAVHRNRVKRLLRQIIFENKSSIKGGIDGVFLVRQSILKIDPKDLESEVKSVLNQAGILA